MAWTNLPTDYEDAAWEGSRKFLMTENNDGTVSFEDRTDYTQIAKSYRSANDVNSTNDAINTIMGIFEGAYKLNEPTNVTIIGGNKSAYLTWTDPENSVRTEDNTVSAQWFGTLVLRKIGEAPNGYDDPDATVVVNEKMRNQYKDTPLTDLGLTNGIEYYYGIYPYTKEKKYTDSYVTSVLVTGIPVAYNATISVTTKPNATVSAISSSETLQATADSNGTCTLSTSYLDKYQLSASLDDWSSNKKNILITTSSNIYNVSLLDTYVFSWIKIKDDLRNGNIDNYSVGDTFSVEVAGDDTYDFVIVAKNHDLPNQLIFGLKANGLRTRRTVNSNIHYKTDPNLSSGESALYTWLNSGFYNLLPEDLKSVISERTMQVSVGEYTQGNLKYITKKIWLPRTYEYTGGGEPSSEQNVDRIHQFEYYKTPPKYIADSDKDGTIASIYTKFINGNNGAYYQLYPVAIFRGSNWHYSLEVIDVGKNICPHFQITAD